jgi:hypothetical protein
MNPCEQFIDQNYLNLETYRRSGEAMQTPVWFVQDGRKFFVLTVADSGKVKRIRNNSSVNVVPCKSDGEPIGDWTPARGREVRNDPVIEEKVDQLLDMKYGKIKREMTRKAAATGRKYTVLEIVFD